FAIIKGILHRKEVENHAWWLVSTVFLIMMPALGRGVQNVYIDMHSADWPDIDIMQPIYLAQFIIIGLLLGGAWKYDKLKHPATYLALGINLFIFLLEPVGKSQAIQDILTSFIKG
ncbi:MAG: hypothetical protein P8X57_09320, partial [Cyclobacteriaceae bacterium]